MFAIGSRVRVRQDPKYPPGPWPGEPTGTVIDGGPSTYTVEFDEPQLDAEGDGPFVMSEVLARYLEPIRG